jgi:hypothetical protein
MVGAGIGAALSVWMLGWEVPRLLLEALTAFVLLGGVVGVLITVVDKYFAGSYVATLLGLFCGGAGGIITWAVLYSITEAVGFPIFFGQVNEALSGGALYGVLIGGLLGVWSASRKSTVMSLK